MGAQTLSVGPRPEIEVEHVGGDLTIEGWDRSEIEVRGDDLNQVQQEGQSVNVSCGGDLHLSLPRGASLDLSEVGGDLKVENVGGTINLSFVGGNANLENLTGEVSVSGVMGDLRMKNVENANIEPARGGAHTDLSERIRRKAEAATQRAQRQAERGLKQAGRAARHARHASRSSGARLEMGRWKWNMTSGSFTPGESSSPVSDEERMAILKMLQEKKITAEEAEKLLAALEGGS